MTITTQDLPAILEAHRKWLRGEEGGTRADLTGAKLGDEISLVGGARAVFPGRADWIAQRHRHFL